MNELLAVALICAATVTPDNCNRETAIDVAVQPVSTPFACLLGGESLVASIGGGKLPEGAYLRIDCERRGRSDLRSAGR